MKSRRILNSSQRSEEVVMKRVLIACDHAILREGIRQILSQSGEFQITDEVNSLGELQKRIEEPLDLIILNPFISGGSGLEYLEKLRNAKSLPNVLLVSPTQDKDFGLRGLKAGALGIVYRNCEPDQLLKAARIVANGNQYISDELAQFLASRYSDKTGSALHQKLSNREYRVLLMIGSGKTATEIARDINLSIKTVSTYRTRIRRKMGLNTNAELIHYVIANKLLETSAVS